MSQNKIKLMATAIDHLARDNPELIFAEFLEPAHLDQDVLELSYQAFGNSINRLSWWLKDWIQEIGLKRFDNVLFTGYPDMRYYLLLIAAIKNEITLMFSGRFNDTEAHLRYIRLTNCKAVLYTNDFPLPELVSGCQIPSFALPHIKTLLDAEKVAPFPYNKSFEEAADDPVCYFYTSGTTGFPKPILWTNTILSGACINQTLAAEFDGRPLHHCYQPNPPELPRRRLLTSVAADHSSMALTLGAAVFVDTICVIPPMHYTSAELTPEKMTGWLRQSRCDDMMAYPARLASAIGNPEYMQELERLKCILVGGAPLSPQFGQLLADKVRIASVWGATELPCMPCYSTDAADWEYFCFDSVSSGIEWRHFAEDKYELVFIRDDTLKTPPQLIFKVFPTEQREYTLKDVFTPHPTKPNHWKFAGRVDDTIILSNAVNINPAHFETAVNKNPFVRSATILGNGRPKPCLILELHNDYDATNGDLEMKVNMQMDQIWPTIEAAMAGGERFARIERDMVIVATKNKPLPRNIKGGIKRNVLDSLYGEEMDSLYQGK